MKQRDWLALVAVIASAMYGQLGYVESSTGFQNNPRLDGGRTELEMADINNDGHVDILSIGDHGSPFVNTQQRGVMVWFGNGAGVWTLHLPDDTLGYGGLAVGDVNNDGLWDAGYGMHHNYARGDLGDQLIEVALGDGTGRRWIAWDDSLAKEGQTWGMHATDFGDFDNDGLLDVGSISFGASDGIHVYKNLGNGSWRRTFGFIGGNSNMEFYFRDINRDARLDIIAAHGTGSIWFGDGAGNFTPANAGLPSSSNGLRGLSPGDVNNDGGSDVAFANAKGGVEVWTWNDSQQRWTAFSGVLPDSGPFQATALCDMDADGFVDLLAFGRGRLRVWIGDGAGKWTEAAALTTPSAGTYAAMRTGADFDHNGRPDIVLWAREGSWPNDINVARAFRETTPVESLGIFPVFPRGGEKFIGGSVQFLDWWSGAQNASETRVRLELSVTGPSGPWELIADSLKNAGRFQWRVPPSAVSEDCRIRYGVYGPEGTASAVTPRSFVIGEATGQTETDGRLRTSRALPMTSVFPNPARGRLLVELDAGVCGGVRYELFDVGGRLLRSWSGMGKSEDGRRVTLPVVDLPGGVYCLTVRGGGVSAVTRVVLLD